MTPKTKLIIYEYKERYPQLSPEFISDVFNIKVELVNKLFNKGEIIIPSKMNK
jgi:hypothetical protein